MLKFAKAISKITESEDIASKSTEGLKTSPIFLTEGRKVKKEVGKNMVAGNVKDSRTKSNYSFNNNNSKWNKLSY